MPKPKSKDGMEGFPEDGDPYIPPDPNGEEDEDNPPITEPDPLDALRQENAELRRSMDGLRQDLAAVRAPPKEPDAPDDFYEDMDSKLFQNPTETLKGIEDRIVSRVSKEMKTSYNKDQGERQFWNDFYAAHADLRPDDDLVKATLQGNMSSLGGLPVSEAITRLADLTRDRIARYAKEPRKRPHTEGARPPTPTPPKLEEDKVVTLSDLIKARRNKRRGHAA